MIPRERPRRRQRAGGVSAVGLVVRWQDPGRRIPKFSEWLRWGPW
jgi:hypothetical protein